MPPRSTRGVTEAPEEVLVLADWLAKTYGYAGPLPNASAWRAQVRVREEGAGSHARDVYFINPEGMTFRTRPAVARYLGLAEPESAETRKRKPSPVAAPPFDVSGMSAEELLAAAMSHATPGERRAEPPAPECVPERVGRVSLLTLTPLRRRKKSRKSAGGEAVAAAAPAPAPQPAVSLPKMPPPPPLFKRPTTLVARQATAPKPAASVPSEAVATPRTPHVCTLACPARCSSWCGLSSLLVAS